MILVLFLLTTLTSGVVHAAKPKTVTLTEKEILKKYSYSDLVQVINGLMLPLGGDDWCSLKMEEAQKLMLPLRPIFEQKLAQEKKAIEKTPIATLEARAKNCDKLCLCANDEDLFSSRKDFPKKILDELTKKNALIVADLKKCGKNSVRFCKDPILSALKEISDREYHAE